MMEDSQLLGAYLETKSEAAFSELVHRHINLVYTTALRTLAGDRHLAEDVTQEVFVALAKKAGTLARHPSLAGWLYTSAHYTAAKMVRTEQRRRAREREAQTMHELQPDNQFADEWERFSPVLDAAIHRLSHSDRQALVGRFLEQRSFADVGATLQVSEEAARKRVDRALDKLRTDLGQRGAHASAATLGTLLSQHAAGAAPPALAAKVSQNAIAATAGMSALTTLSLFTMSKLSTLGSAAIAAALAVTFLVSSQQIGRLKDGITEIREQTAQHHAATRQSEALTAELRGTLLALPASAPLATPPAAPSPQARASRMLLLDRKAPLFRQLGLDPTELAELKELMIERELGEGEARRFAQREGLNINQLNWPELHTLYRTWTESTDAKIRELVGDQRAPYLFDYEYTYALRVRLNDAAKILQYSTSPLTDDQADEIVRRMAAAVPESLSNNKPDYASEMKTVAEPILDSHQLAVLRRVLERNEAIPSIRAANLAAAKQGLLHLSPQSAKHYPTPQSPGNNRGARPPSQ